MANASAFTNLHKYNYAYPLQDSAYRNRNKPLGPLLLATKQKVSGILSDHFASNARDTKTKFIVINACFIDSVEVLHASYQRDI